MFIALLRFFFHSSLLLPRLRAVSVAAQLYRGWRDSDVEPQDQQLRALRNQQNHGSGTQVCVSPAFGDHPMLARAAQASKQALQEAGLQLCYKVSHKTRRYSSSECSAAAQAFDLLYLDDSPLIELPLIERRGSQHQQHQQQQQLRPSLACLARLACSQVDLNREGNPAAIRSCRAENWSLQEGCARACTVLVLALSLHCIAPACLCGLC